MKTLRLLDFLDTINGTLIKGIPEFEINKVERMIKNLSDHSLYFHTSKKSIEPDTLKGKVNYTIVTDDKETASIVDPTACVILVENCKEAFWRFVEFYRKQFDIPVIGVTGTCGKTTIKDMIKHILAESLKVHATMFSQNGLYLNLHYLMGLNEQTDAAVFEMGVAYPGNVKISGRYFKPTIGVISNIGVAHLDGCKTLEKYIMAKGEMLEVLTTDGTLIYNADDENIKRLPIEEFKGKKFLFGQCANADFRAGSIQYQSDRMVYTLHAQNKEYEVNIPGYGEHNVYNSLAAIASASLTGIPIEDAVRRLSTFKPLERHVKKYEGYNHLTVIDDTWSCNPSSVKSALEVLKKFSNNRTGILVLGKMQRLGSQLIDQHLKMGERLMDIGGIDYLITVGPAAKLTGEKAISLGMDSSKVFTVSEDDAGELEAKLAEICKENMVLLFKMSLSKMDPSFRKVVEKYRFS
nr:UDP-N-acetylmuramoyl-tripeptide--D-alanyl-D-alanine ligase [Neobacillus sp. Marseille-Q6967]